LASEISLDAARYFAELVHLAPGRKRDLREFAETLIRLQTDKTRYNDRRGNVEIADQFADEASMFAYRKRIGDTGITWTWKVLAQKFLEYQKPKLKPKYREQYEHYLTLPEFAQ